MNCYKCRGPIEERQLQWTARGDKGLRHITCPKKNSLRAVGRRRREKRMREAAQK